MRTTIGFCMAVIVATASLLLWFQMSESDPGAPNTFFDFVTVGVIGFILGTIYSILLSAIPFLLLFRLGRVLNINGLLFSLLTGVLSAEWVWLFTFGILKLAMPGEALTNEVFLSPSRNAATSFAGVIGGIVLWQITIRSIPQTMPPSVSRRTK